MPVLVAAQRAVLPSAPAVEEIEEVLAPGHGSFRTAPSEVRCVDAVIRPEEFKRPASCGDPVSRHSGARRQRSSRREPRWHLIGAVLGRAAEDRRRPAEASAMPARCGLPRKRAPRVRRLSAVSRSSRPTGCVQRFSRPSNRRALAAQRTNETIHLVLRKRDRFAPKRHTARAADADSLLLSAQTTACGGAQTRSCLQME
jgi:hypothetical protein